MAGGADYAVGETGPGPMGPTRMLLEQAVIAAIEGLCRRRRARAGAVVRLQGRVAGRDIRRVQSPRSACR